MASRSSAGRIGKKANSRSTVSHPILAKNLSTARSGVNGEERWILHAEATALVRWGETVWLSKIPLKPCTRVQVRSCLSFWRSKDAFEIKPRLMSDLENNFPGNSFLDSPHIVHAQWSIVLELGKFVREIMRMARFMSNLYL